ncbi:unnamed protein product [Arctia plantaginis]|uniref:Phenoloxidase-activating factor 2 n=1 Tax=Arctia plantaginis TaxID=874455 RepID=A0A8S1BD22_ARCPL|nr:unnamed protein product [Arctia plantaginis]
MRWSTLILVILSISCATKAEWSWGAESNTKQAENDEQKSTSLLQGEQLPEAEKKQYETNGTVLDDIVDELVSSKQGRSLGGFDDVYSDPTIKDALDAGDDVEARNLIKGRLCTLGLIQCEEEETQEKRYLSPDDVIYAQPVDIKPIGKPVPSIPIRGPPRAYGPPQPVPYPGRPQKFPPKRIGYGGSGRPGFADKYGVASNSYQFSQSSLYNGPETNYVTKPPGYSSQSPYTFENSKPSYNKIPSSQSGSKQDSIVQQHIHHHYVHGDTDKEPKVIIKPVAIPVGSVGQLSQAHVQQSSDVITAGGGDYSGINSGGFQPMSGSYPLDSNKPIYESDAIYGSQFGHNSYKGGANVLNQGLPNQYPNNVFEDQKYGNGLGTYGQQSNEFYKKELHVGSGNNLYSQGPATFGQSDAYAENYHEAKAQGFECVCVNYDQCPSQEVIGRRDDLYLPIDPRNKGSEISALTEEQLDTINKTENSQNSTSEETKPISKRETKEKEASPKADEEIEPRPRFPGFSGLSSLSNNIDYRHVQPTFGISFGLPPSITGPTPFNPHLLPHMPAIGGGGFNLGLVSANPLISIQVTKDDYGEKVYKPLIHVHVVPNPKTVATVGQLFHQKKQFLLHKHQSLIVPPIVPVPHIPYPHSYPGPHHLHLYANSYNPHHYEGLPHFHSNEHSQNYESEQIHRPYSAHYIDYESDKFQEQDYSNFEPPLGNDDYYDESGSDVYYRNRQTINNQNNRSAKVEDENKQGIYAKQYDYSQSQNIPSKPFGASRGGRTIRFPDKRRKREIIIENSTVESEERQAYFGRPPVQQCRPNQVCCRRPLQPQAANKGQCGIRHSQGINGRIKTPAYVDGESEFGEYPWQTAILKKDPKESVYVCGGTLIDGLHIITAAHCVKSYKGFELRVRLGEWDVNRDVEFYPYIERDIVSVHVHPLYYAGTLDNDLAILKMDHPVEWTKYPHISPACLPDKYTDYAGQRCWTTGWGKDAFGDYGKYQNILKEVDVPIHSHGQCQQQLRKTRLGHNYELNPGFLCAGGEEGKDACKGDGGGPLVCERGGTWQIVGVVSWGIGCGQPGVPGVYVKVAHYLDWIAQITGKFSPY